MKHTTPPVNASPKLRRSTRRRFRDPIYDQKQKEIRLEIERARQEEIRLQIESGKRPTWEDLQTSAEQTEQEEEPSRRRINQSSRKRPSSPAGYRDIEDGAQKENAKRCLIVKFPLNLLVQFRRTQSKSVTDGLISCQATSIDKSEIAPSAIPTPSGYTLSYQESIDSENPEESTSDGTYETAEYTSTETPSCPSKSSVNAGPPQKHLACPPRHLTLPDAESYQQPALLSLAPEKQYRTTLRVSLATPAVGFVPLRLRSCMSISAFFDPISTASGHSDIGKSVLTVLAIFDWKAETDIDKKICIRRDLDDSFDIFLETIAEATCWEQEGGKCGVEIEVVGTFPVT